MKANEEHYGYDNTWVSRIPGPKGTQAMYLNLNLQQHQNV